VALAPRTQEVLAQTKRSRSELVRIGPTARAYQGLDTRIDPRGGDDVAREWGSAAAVRGSRHGIVDRNGRSRQVATLHSGRRDLRRYSVALYQAHPFIAHEVEQLVLLDWSADGAAELVVDERQFRFRAICEPRVGFQTSVGVVFEQRAVDGVGSALDCDTDGPPARGLVRVERVAGHADRLNGF